MVVEVTRRGGESGWLFLTNPVWRQRGEARGGVETAQKQAGVKLGGRRFIAVRPAQGCGMVAHADFDKAMMARQVAETAVCRRRQRRRWRPGEAGHSDGGSMQLQLKRRPGG